MQFMRGNQGTVRFSDLPKGTPGFEFRLFGSHVLISHAPGLLPSEDSDFENGICSHEGAAYVSVAIRLCSQPVLSVHPKPVPLLGTEEGEVNKTILVLRMRCAGNQARLRSHEDTALSGQVAAAAWLPSTKGAGRLTCDLPLLVTICL